eukprot:CAMPEP_0198118354 /NCGR_PEP_ID=MMETSP1442-20131203/21341_1 /TAXON_ID= /ORGANISM="Craspedostauros australis, Strain CCMP3328" /LENGTH=248 /DNA_ID=CAMNT_0043776599 /DNA_START=142 /DNA_END=885 /DNA_ORIENTATION=+
MLAQVGQITVQSQTMELTPQTARNELDRDEATKMMPHRDSSDGSIGNNMISTTDTNTTAPFPSRRAQHLCMLPQLLDELSFDVEYRHRDTKVWFGNVEIHEFAYAIGDNPSVTDGCPLSMTMHAVGAKQCHRITNYESIRCTQRRRSRRELRIPAQRRFRILQEDVGLSVYQILERTSRVAKERERRRRTSRAQLCEVVYNRLRKEMEDERLARIAKNKRSWDDGSESTHLKLPQQRLQTQTTSHSSW